MKILLVSRFFPYIGGREVLVMLLAQELSKEHRVVIATPDIGRVSKDFQIISNDQKSLERCFEEFKPDVANSHTFYLTPDLIKLAKKHNVPVVLTIHGDIFGFDSEPDKKMFKEMIPNLNTVVAVCGHGRNRMLKNGVERGNLATIYPGIDIKMFDGETKDKRIFRRSFQLPDDKFIFITPARMTRYKGIEVLLDAISLLDKKVRDNSLFWITTPATRYRDDELSYTKTIFDGATTLGVRDNIMVSFSDFFSMPFAYRAANAFVLPSLTEQFPVTILEAMASYLPVVATNVGGVSEVVNEKTGFLITPDSPEELKSAISNVFYGRDTSKVQEAKDTVVHNFNLGRMVDEYLKLYKHLQNDSK